MSEQFYNILTNVGKAQIANSNVLGNKINFVKFKVGDGGGKYYNPTPEQQDLINTVWEGAINSIFIDENNSNWIVVQAIIPTNVGGFMIREAAVFDDNDNMIAIGKYPETYKPIFTEGSAKDLIIKIIFEVSNAENITLKVDPTVTLATKNDIKTLETKMLGLLEKHSLNMDHIYYCGQSEGENNIYQVNPGSAPNLQEGLAISIKAHRDSTAECKCVYKNSSQINILKSNGKPIKNLKKDSIYTMRYNGENFILQGEGANGTAKSPDLLLGKTAESDEGELVGTIPTKMAQTYTPSVSDQIIQAGQYLGENQIIKGDSNLISANIPEDVSLFGIRGAVKRAKTNGALIATKTAGELSGGGYFFRNDSESSVQTISYDIPVDAFIICQSNNGSSSSSSSDTPFFYVLINNGVSLGDFKDAFNITLSEDRKTITFKHLTTTGEYLAGKEGLLVAISYKE